jgi:hypothetical protein
VHDHGDVHAGPERALGFLHCGMTRGLLLFAVAEC